MTTSSLEALDPRVNYDLFFAVPQYDSDRRELLGIQLSAAASEVRAQMGLASVPFSIDPFETKDYDAASGRDMDFAVRPIQDTIWFQVGLQHFGRHNPTALTGPAITLPSDLVGQTSELYLGSIERRVVEFDANLDAMSQVAIGRDAWESYFPGRPYEPFRTTNGQLFLSLNGPRVQVLLLVPHNLDIAYDLHSVLPMLVLCYLKVANVREHFRRYALEAHASESKIRSVLTAQGGSASHGVYRNLQKLEEDSASLSSGLGNWLTLLFGSTL